MLTKITFSVTIPNLLESSSEIGDGLFLRRLFSRVEENIKFWLVHCSAGASPGKWKNIFSFHFLLFYLFGGRV